MPGRKAYPFSIMKATNDRNHLTKAELKGRETGEPRIHSHDLKCPDHLSPEAKKEWRRIVKLYQELDTPILCDLDSVTLEIFCEAVATYRRAMAKVHETSEVYVSKYDQTRPRKNPWLTVANEAAFQIKKYGEVLLLDPVSRARVGLAQSAQKEESPMMAFLRERKERMERDR